MIKRIQLYKFNYSSVTYRPTYRVGQKSEVANSWSLYSVIFLMFSFCGGLQNVFTGRFIGKFAVTGDQKFLHSLHIKKTKKCTRHHVRACNFATYSPIKNMFRHSPINVFFKF